MAIAIKTTKATTKALKALKATKALKVPTKADKITAPTKADKRLPMTQVTREALVLGTSYDRQELKALFAHNDSNIGAAKASRLQRDPRDPKSTIPLFKCGDFGGVRGWFTPSLQEYETHLTYVGETMRIGGFWYSTPEGTACKTRNEVLLASVFKFLKA